MIFIINYSGVGSGVAPGAGAPLVGEHCLALA